VSIAPAMRIVWKLQDIVESGFSASLLLRERWIIYTVLLNVTR